MATVNVTDENFEDVVLKANGPVVVDFWAEWCGPCKMIGPALEELSDEYGDKLTIAKLNIDDSPQRPNQFGVRSIPTMILFENGEARSTKLGAAPKSQLADWINSNVGQL